MPEKTQLLRARSKTPPSLLTPPAKIPRVPEEIPTQKTLDSYDGFLQVLHMETKDLDDQELDKHLRKMLKDDRYKDNWGLHL